MASLFIPDDLVKPAIFGTVALILGIAVLRTYLVVRASGSWPCVEGKVTSGRAKRISTGRGSGIWYAELTYVFKTIEGDRYAGRVDYAKSNAQQAEECVHQMKDAKVSVRYKPGDPDTSLAELV